MPKLSGVFDNFKNLSNIPVADIQRWLKFRVEPHMLENFIGNRILYPQSIPITKQDMDIDLAILRELIRLNSQLFYDPIRLRLVFPQEYTIRFRQLSDLIWAFTDALALKELTKIYVKDWAGTHMIGTIVKSVSQTGIASVVLENKTFKLKSGSLTAIPFLKKEGMITLDGRTLAVSGGEAGVFIDLRKGV